MAPQPKNSNSSCSGSCASRLMTWLSILTVFLAACIGFDRIMPRFYLFDPKVLQAVGQRNMAAYGNDTHTMITRIAEELDSMYPGHINLKEEWIFNNAGGAMGSMWILHGSFSEYVIIFGTPVGTEGHTGRYLVDNYFTILEGEQWAFSPGQLTREVYKPGEIHHLPRGHCQQYKIPEHLWALEYSRGWIPLMLPFGFADSFFSTVDMINVYDQVRIYGGLLIKELFKGKI